MQYIIMDVISVCSGTGMSSYVLGQDMQEGNTFNESNLTTYTRAASNSNDDVRAENRFDKGIDHGTREPQVRHASKHYRTYKALIVHASDTCTPLEW